MKTAASLLLLGTMALGGINMVPTTQNVVQEPQVCECVCECVFEVSNTCNPTTISLSDSGTTTNTISETIIKDTVIQDSGDIIIENNKINFHPHINNVDNDKVNVHINNNGNNNGNSGSKGNSVNKGNK